MKTYQVSIFTPFDYDIEASSQQDAIEKAEKLAQEEIDNSTEPFMFQVNHISIL